MCGHIFERGNADRRKRYLTFGMQAWNNFHPPLSLVTKHLRIINKTLCTNSWNWCQNRSAESGLGISDMSHTSVWLIVMSHMWVKVRHKACEINLSAWHGWHTTFDFRCAMITLIRNKQNGIELFRGCSAVTAILFKLVGKHTYHIATFGRHVKVLRWHQGISACLLQDTWTNHAGSQKRIEPFNISWSTPNVLTRSQH